MAALTQVSIGADGSADVGQFLKKHETASAVTEVAPFTIIKVHYVKPGSYITSEDRFYYRILFTDRVFLDESDHVEEIRQWEGLEPPTFLVGKTDGKHHDKSPLYVLSSGHGKAVMEQIKAGSSDWSGELGFPLGYPIDVNTRYFPRNATDEGFLLQAKPLAEIVLPKGIDCCASPSINKLASISPDGKAFAYADSRDKPSVLMVVSKNGKQQAPIPIPLAPMDDYAAGYDKSPFERLWRWLPMHFRWAKDVAGDWNLAAQNGKAGGIGGTNTLESLFLSSRDAYRICFASSNADCIGDWREAADKDWQYIFGQTPAIRMYGYVPTTPSMAFDTGVDMLSFGPTGEHGWGYHLFLHGPMEKVTETIQRRMASRKINYLRADHCPSYKRNDCRENLAKKLKEKFPNLASDMTDFAWMLDEQARNGVVFVTPDTAFLVSRSQMENGTTGIFTLVRYDSAAGKSGR